MDDVGLRTLRIVDAVATHRSFRSAAHELGLPASTVSHVVASLERQLGIRLFMRNTRSVSLTEAGESFLRRVRPALVEIRGAIDGIHDLRDRPAGLVRINASSWGAERLLPLVLAFMRAEPEVRIDLVVDGRLVDIVAEGFDAGLRLASMVPPDMVALPLGVDESLILVAAPSYLKSRGTPRKPADLLSHECIRARLPSGTVMGWELQRGRESLEPRVAGRLIVGNVGLAARAALAGVGIAYVEARDAAPHLASGELVALLSEWTPPVGSEALYYPASRLPSASFRAFVDFVRAARPTGSRRQRASSKSPSSPKSPRRASKA